MHNADVNKHVGDKTPRFVALIGIVDEQCRRWTICAFANTAIIFRIISAKKTSASGLRTKVIIVFYIKLTESVLRLLET